MLKSLYSTMYANKHVHLMSDSLAFCGATTARKVQLIISDQCHGGCKAMHFRMISQMRRLRRTHYQTLEFFPSSAHSWAHACYECASCLEVCRQIVGVSENTVESSEHEELHFLCARISQYHECPGELLVLPSMLQGLHSYRGDDAPYRNLFRAGGERGWAAEALACPPLWATWAAWV